MRNDNYISRKHQLLKSFDKSITRSKRVLISRYGNEHTNSLISKFRSEYEALIPQIPYIGEMNPFLIFLLPTSRNLAIYRVLQRQGQTAENAGQMIYEMIGERYKAIPRLIRHMIGYLFFSRWSLGLAKKLATESQKRKYPESYVMTYVEGNGKDFDYGIDYTECAICKFLSAQNALELIPYMCAADKIGSELLGWGMSRTMTLAKGDEKCDFRFKKGGKTNILS
ncbi:MAG: L-2-amino-thiazoline-4-carboxylic acid hydrolase [Smithella sp.]